MNKIETRAKFFDRQAAVWDRKITPEQLGRLSAIFKMDIPRLNPPLLDVGCGTGILIPFLRQKVDHDSTIIELDLSREMLVIASQKAQSSAPINFVQADVEALPFPQQTFGSVVCFSAFPHFQCKPRALAEIHRCLAERGHMIVLHLMDHQELNAIHKRKGTAVANDRMPPAETFASFMEKLGFSIELVRECSSQYLIVAQK